MEKQWISYFRHPTYVTSNKDYYYPIFGYVIKHEFSKRERHNNYIRTQQIFNKQDIKCNKYKSAGER
jgi:hypothetical protein